MLKGHATIDLHDTIRGTYKRFEKDNLVTNAYKYHLQSSILMNGENSAIDPVSRNGALPLARITLGGLMLFDGALTENANNVQFPGDVHLMGYSDDTVDLSNPLRGSYNTLESGATGQGYTHVWDFTTAQGNGEIASLALTNVKGGADPIGCCLNKDISGDTNSRLQYQYHDGIYGYYFNISGQSATISKSYQPHTGIKVSTYNLAGTVVATYTVDMSDDDDAILQRFCWQYAGNGDFYGAEILADNNDPEQDLTVRVAKIHTDDWENFTYTPAEDIVLEGVTGRKTYTLNGSNLYIHAQPPVVSGHHIFIREYKQQAGAQTIVYIADLTNTADVIATTFTKGQIEYGIGSLAAPWDYRTDYPAPGGAADFWYKPASQYRRVRIYNDGVMRDSCTETARLVMRGLAAKNAPINAHYGVSTGSNWGVYLQTNYLGTICNLTTPIEKTAASTMKITYTLTDVS